MTVLVAVNVKVVYAECASKGYAIIYPQLRSCFRYVEQRKECVKLPVLGFVTDCEEGNKKARKPLRGSWLNLTMRLLRIMVKFDNETVGRDVLWRKVVNAPSITGTCWWKIEGYVWLSCEHYERAVTSILGEGGGGGGWRGSYEI